MNAMLDYLKLMRILELAIVECMDDSCRIACDIEIYARTTNMVRNLAAAYQQCALLAAELEDMDPGLTLPSGEVV